jgi:hypothetical protein
MTGPIGFQLTFEVERDHLDVLLTDLALKLSPPGLAGFLDTVVDPFIRSRIEQRFDTEGDDVTGSWHPLTIATQQIRASYGFPPAHPINVRTRDLRDWLVNTPADIKVTGFTAEANHPPPTSNTVLNTKLAAAQSGKTHPATPARPVLGLNENDLMFVTSSLVAYIAKGII